MQKGASILGKITKSIKKTPQRGLGKKNAFEKSPWGKKKWGLKGSERASRRFQPRQVRWKREKIC